MAELEARLTRNARNASSPPSKDPPSVPKDPPKPPTGRQRGGQPGHQGKGRKLVPLERVDELVAVKPECCKGCEHLLSGEDPSPYRHQVTEIPQLRPHITEYRLHMLRCSHCGERTCATLPDGVSNSAFGVRLQAMVALCTGVYRLSRRTVEALLGTMPGVEMSLGTVSACEARVSEALVAPVADAQAHVQAQPVVNADETGWRGASARAWLWVAVSPLVTVFLVHGKRGTVAAKALLGEFAGVLVSDRWSAYSAWEVARRQRNYSGPRWRVQRKDQEKQWRNGTLPGLPWTEAAFNAMATGLLCDCNNGLFPLPCGPSASPPE